MTDKQRQYIVYIINKRIHLSSIFKRECEYEIRTDTCDTKQASEVINYIMTCNPNDIQDYVIEKLKLNLKTTKEREKELEERSERDKKRNAEEAKMIEENKKKDKYYLFPKCIVCRKPYSVERKGLFISQTEGCHC